MPEKLPPFPPMRSHATADFWRCYARLPNRVQQRALKQYRLWLDNPLHPSVGFKRVGRYWSARVSGKYRAIGVMTDDTVVWFCIGLHDEYERVNRS